MLSNTWITLDELYEAILCCFFVSRFKQIPSCFSCLGEFCDSVVPCSSRNVLWTARFHHPFRLHVGELVMTGMLVELMTFFMTKHQEHTQTQLATRQLIHTYCVSYICIHKSGSLSLTHSASLILHHTHMHTLWQWVPADIWCYWPLLAEWWIGHSVWHMYTNLK